MGAEVYAPLAPVLELSLGESRGSPWCVSTLRWPRTVRVKSSACRHHRPVWEPARSRSVRAAWFARGGRWFYLRPLRSTSLLAHRLFGFERQAPRRASCTPRGFHHGQRRCSLPSRSVAHHAGGAWSKRDRLLTSFVAVRARITGSSRLTAAADAPHLAVLRAGGFTRSARLAYRPPREGRPFDEPGRLRPYREAS